MTNSLATHARELEKRCVDTAEGERSDFEENDYYECATVLRAYADLRERQAAGVTDAVVEQACQAMGRSCGYYPAWPDMRAALLAALPVAAEPAQPADSGRVGDEGLAESLLQIEAAEYTELGRLPEDVREVLRRASAALAAQGQAKVYQCPRCATAMQVDPTAKPAPPASPAGVPEVDFQQMAAAIAHLRNSGRHARAAVLLDELLVAASAPSAGVPEEMVLVATALHSDPYDDTGATGLWLSLDDRKRMDSLPAGTRIYAAAPSAPEGDGGAK